MGYKNISCMLPHMSAENGSCRPTFVAYMYCILHVCMRQSSMLWQMQKKERRSDCALEDFVGIIIHLFPMGSLDNREILIS